MHQAISHIWNTKTRNEKNIEKIIKENITEYVNKSLLSQGDKEALKQELIDNASIVSRALRGHFDVPFKVSTEKWVETPFDSTFDNEKITIPIHGKLDAIIDSGDSVNVFDYKTKQGMTEKAIRGETKNDDGIYFRQLVFYKMLLLGDFYTRNKNILTSLVFVSPDSYGNCPIVTLKVEDEDIRKVKEEINDLIRVVWSGTIAKKYCNDSTCEYCAYRRLATRD